MARPTKYKKEYCKKMFEFFNIPHTLDKAIINYDKDGNEKISYVEKANILPTFEKFAVNIGVCRDTLDAWTKEYQEFSDTYKKCKNLQKDMLNDLAMRGFYNPTYTIFVAKNITDMRDKQEVVTTPDDELRERYLEAMKNLNSAVNPSPSDNQHKT